MSAGITVYNNNNILQISESFSTMELVAKVTVSTGTSIQIPLYDTIAFKVPNGYWCSILTGQYYSQDNTQYIKFIGNSNITYYQFRYSSGTIPAGNYFEIYDTNGNRIFSDGQQSLKVLSGYLGTYTGSAHTSETDGTGWGRSMDGTIVTSCPSRVNQAILLNTPCTCMGWNYSGGQTEMRFHQQLGFSFNSDNSISALLKTTQNENNYGEEYWQIINDYSFLTVDISNL